MSYLDELAERLRAHIPDEVLPREGDLDRLLRLYAVLVRAKGENVTLEDVHDVWVARMTDVDPGHAALQPYEVLDVPTRREDAPFAEAIRMGAREEAR